MLPFAHLGIGSALARPWWKRVPVSAVLFGTLLPDLIDKPVYYFPAWITGLRGAELGFFSGTRTAGHTLAFLAFLVAVGLIPGARRRWWLGAALGVATHLLLDNVLEPFAPLTDTSSRIALLFPYYGWRFPIAPFRTAGAQLLAHLSPLELTAEAAGLFLLGRLWRTRRNDT